MTEALAIPDAAPVRGSTSPPLVVDLDDTLLRSDLLHESVFALLRHSPLCLFLLPFWLLQGKARLKHEIARRVELDVTTLPYDEEFLGFLREEKANGRRLILATASNEKLAHAVAGHLGLFDDVLASDATTNLHGHTKAEVLQQRFAETGFDYAGNGNADMPIWRVARAAVVVGGSAAIEQAVSAEASPGRRFPRRQRELWSYISALRVHQWLKNLLVFVPLITAARFTEIGAVLQLVVAFFAFSLCASGVYVLNDLLDLEDDRSHPRKRHRPFASGDLPIAHGCVLVPVLLAASLALALWLPVEFLMALGLYYATTLAYSLKLKHTEILDILTLALLYTIRIVGGGAAVGIPLTVWLLGFSLFLFLSLAIAKRCAELVVMRGNGEEAARGRGYRVADLPLLHSLGVGAGYASILILALYLTSDTVTYAYGNPAMLWVFCPMLLFWITRVWLKTYRGEMHDDPVVFAARDSSSRVLAVIGGVSLLFAL